LTLRRHGRIRPGTDAVHVQGEGRDAQNSCLELEAVLLVELLSEPAAGRVAGVRERREAACGGRTRLLLVKRLLRTRARLPAVPRVRVRTLAEIGLCGIEPFERRDRDEHLAAH